MDWRHHPGKTQAWYDAKRQKAEDEGLLHNFAKEVDRDYSAAVQGTVIPAAWVRAAIDADKVLQLDDSGTWMAGLDVADEGGDTNALALRKGIVLHSITEWGDRDTGKTARLAVDLCANAIGPLGRIRIQYDAGGVGAGVKGETNRLMEDKLLPKGIRLVQWFGASRVEEPDQRVIPKDRDTPLNKDFFANLKAQGWWALRRRFELTHKAVTMMQAGTPYEYDPDELIVLPSSLPLVWKLVKELSQPTRKETGTGKMLIDKKPDGTKSPNLADAVVMAFFPVKALGLPSITADMLARI
jgi:hypothetical protein